MAETVIVIGGSSGIGEATARLFLARGAHVVIAGRDEDRLAAAAVRLASPALQPHRLDAGDRAAVRGFFAAVGPFRHLVLSLSGARGAGPFAQLDLDDLRAGLEAKLLPQLTCAQAALATLARDGSITFVSAASARAHIPGTAGLAAINGALEAMVPTLALELAPVRVNAVSPGVVDTPWWQRVPEATRAALFADAARTLPAHRVGRPEDVAEAIVLAATNGFMTGAVLPVDGGAPLARG